MLRPQSRRDVSVHSLHRHQSLCTLRFPNKLWRIVNDCKTGAIAWSNDGKSVVIDYAKFQMDYLANRLGIFKTSNISSFVRQLNLYGFRKVIPRNRVAVKDQCPADIHLFRNGSFLRDRPDLLENVTRKARPLSIREVRQRPKPKPRIPHAPHPRDGSPTPRSTANGQHVSHLRDRIRNTGSVNGTCDMSDDTWPLKGCSCAACMGDDEFDKCYQGCCRSAVEGPGLDIHQILDPSKSPKRVCLAFEEDNYCLHDFFGLESFSGEPLGEVYDVFMGDVTATDLHNDGSLIANAQQMNPPDATDTEEKELLSTAMQIAACFSGSNTWPEIHNPGGSSDETPSDWTLNILAADIADYAELQTLSDPADIEGYAADAAHLSCISGLSSISEAGSTAENGILF